jgi:hypothetical protein
MLAFRRGMAGGMVDEHDAASMHDVVARPATRFVETPFCRADKVIDGDSSARKEIFLLEGTFFFEDRLAGFGRRRPTVLARGALLM